MKEIPTSALLQELLARVRAREGTETVSPREWNIVYKAIEPLRFRQQDRFANERRDLTDANPAELYKASQFPYGIY